MLSLMLLMQACSAPPPEPPHDGPVRVLILEKQG